MKRKNKYRGVKLTDELRIEEIALLFGKTRQTISLWLKSGKLESREIKDVIEFYKYGDKWKK